ncbi:MAG: alpha-amylase family protein [Lentisphaeria bacterium]
MSESFGNRSVTMHPPKYIMFFDHHTMKACPDVGHHFDADEFASSLQAAGVDLLGFHAKCNQGFCYYDTQTGIRHPSLPPGRDLFGETVMACNQRGIAVTAYLNCGLSNEDAIRHPEWSMISPDGKMLHPDIYDIGWVTPYMRTMCLNSPYRDYLLNLIKEVRDKYPVSGFLLDSFNGFPCICPHCIEGMKQQHMDWQDEAEVRKFGRMSALRLAEDISALLRPQENKLLVYYLGISPKDNARIGTYLECECLPTNPGWGYDYLPLTARYYRNLTSGPVLNMTGRFYDWGDFGSLRPQAGVEYDLFFGLANGMRPNIGDHFHPSGKLNRAALERAGNIYTKLRRYEPWFSDVRNQVDIGVVLPGALDKSPSLVGVTRMLSELKMQFDFIDADCDWSGYKLLILPDEVILDKRLATLVQAHLACGKKVLATGRSGLNGDGTAFCFEKEWGVKYVNPCTFSPAYFQLTGDFVGRVPDMPLATYTTGLCTKALPGSKVAGHVVAPYYNKHWDGVYSYYYAPPDQETEIPFLVLNEQTAYCAFPIFEGYYKLASVDLRHVLAIMLEHLLPKPLLITDASLPSFARAFITANTRQRIVHLLNYLPELRGKTLIVEEELPLSRVNLKLRLDGMPVRRLYIAPDQQAIPFSITEDYLSFMVPELRGYCMIVAELSDAR